MEPIRVGRAFELPSNVFGIWARFGVWSGPLSAISVSRTGSGCVTLAEVVVSTYRVTCAIDRSLHANLHVHGRVQMRQQVHERPASCQSLVWPGALLIALARVFPGLKYRFAEPDS